MFGGKILKPSFFPRPPRTPWGPASLSPGGGPPFGINLFAFRETQTPLSNCPPFPTPGPRMREKSWISLFSLFKWEKFLFSWIELVKNSLNPFFGVWVLVGLPPFPPFLKGFSPLPIPRSPPIGPQSPFPRVFGPLFDVFPLKFKNGGKKVPQNFRSPPPRPWKKGNLPAIAPLPFFPFWRVNLSPKFFFPPGELSSPPGFFLVRAPSFLSTSAPGPRPPGLAYFFVIGLKPLCGAPGWTDGGWFGGIFPVP